MDKIPYWLVEVNYRTAMVPASPTDSLATVTSEDKVLAQLADWAGGQLILVDFFENTKPGLGLPHLRENKFAFQDVGGASNFVEYVLANLTANLADITVMAIVD